MVAYACAEKFTHIPALLLYSLEQRLAAVEGEDADVDYYIHDFFKVPEDINAHDYSTEYKDELLPDEEAVKFCTAITRYIAYEKNVLTLKTDEAEKPAETQNKESSDGEEQKSEKPKDEKSAN